MKIDKIGESERTITATFTQREWNDIYVSFGAMACIARKEARKADGLGEGVSSSEELEFFEFLILLGGKQ